MEAFHWNQWQNTTAQKSLVKLKVLFLKLFEQKFKTNSPIPTDQLPLKDTKVTS